MYKLLLIALGGAVGTLARYGTGALMSGPHQRTGFPFGTLTVNLLGCFIMGLLQGVFSARLLAHFPEEYRLALLVGFLGGYTTFSSYGWETSAFLLNGQWAMAAWTIGASNVIGIPLVIVGYVLGRQL